MKGKEINRSATREKEHLSPSSGTIYAGWDVGGWHCDTNAKSRDALVLLDGGLSLIGKPWRGNLKDSILEAGSAKAWLRQLCTICATTYPRQGAPFHMAIDIPLGFPASFVSLLNTGACLTEMDDSANNPYLFRATERFLFEKGWRPLSPLKDMIGSQATKGMHVLAKFAPHLERLGVWTDGHGFYAFESYPSVGRRHPRICELRSHLPKMPDADREDALVCALTAYLYANERHWFYPPIEGTPETEGWIWVPGND